MTKTNIAFVILTWNSEQFITSCLDSILALKNVYPVIFVIDNGSTDKTPRILDKYVKGNNNLLCTFLPENYGTTVSRNIALANIPKECEYVCILDSDTIVNESAILTMIDTLKTLPNIGIVGPTMKNTKGEKQLSGRNLPTIAIKLGKAFPMNFVQKKATKMEVPNSAINEGLQEVPYLLSACWLMTRSTLQKVGLLDERIFYAPEDVDYCVRVHQAGLKVVRCWNAEITHEYQRISHKRLFSKTNIEHLKGLVYYFIKYGYCFNSGKALRK